MNHPTIQSSASSLFQAMRNRWRTSPTSASMTLSQGLYSAEDSHPGRRVRLRSLSELHVDPLIRDLSHHDISDSGSIHPEYPASSTCPNCGHGDVAQYASTAKRKCRNCKHEFMQEDITGDEKPDYDPSSPEPRFLQLAKAELLRRRDLKCRDCGFVGLPASVDQHCPDCGGIMDEPELQMTTAASTADQIRAAIRQQVADQNHGLNRDKGTQNAQDESVHSSVPNHQHDIHLTDLINHYGCKANGDHYTLHGHHDKLYVSSTGQWVHQHHGVHHEGHGHKSLAAHLERYGNHRS